MEKVTPFVVVNQLLEVLGFVFVVHVGLVNGLVVFLQFIMQEMQVTEFFDY